MNEIEKREYELLYFINPEVPEDKLDSEVAELGKIISENSGENVRLNPPEQKRLAYPIKKHDQVFLGLAYFAADSEGLNKIKKTLSFHKKLLRFLIVTADSKPALPEPKTPIQPQTFEQKLENILNR